MITGETKLIGLLGHPVAHSLSPRMQNAAFAALALDFVYVPLDVPPERLEGALRGLVDLGFAGANVTAPHKRDVARLVEAHLPSVNTLAVRDGALHAWSTDAAVLAGLPQERPVIVGDGGAAAAFREALPQRARLRAARRWPPDVTGADLVVHATSVRDEVLFELEPHQTLVDLPYPETATAAAARAAGARVADGLEVLVAQGAAAFELWTGVPAPRDVMRAAVRSRRVTLELATAGESHGPALVAIVAGLPAGLTLDRAAIDDDLRRRQQGYGRSPRQQLEQDEVEVLAGLRHGRTLGTPLALVVRNRDHKNWTWGMSPWPPEGEPAGKGTKPVTLPRPGHADLAGVLKYGHEDVRDALERASARHTAVFVAAGAVAKTLLRELGIDVAGTVAEIGGERDGWEARSMRRAPTATRSAASSRCGRRACRPGSARTRGERTGSTRASPRR